MTVDLQSLVGLEVDSAGVPGDHGTITRATYNPHGDLVLVIHPDPHAVTIAGDVVLLGKAAQSALDTCDHTSRSAA